MIRITLKSDSVSTFSNARGRENKEKVATVAQVNLGGKRED